MEGGNPGLNLIRKKQKLKRQHRSRQPNMAKISASSSWQLSVRFPRRER